MPGTRATAGPASAAPGCGRRGGDLQGRWSGRGHRAAATVMADDIGYRLPPAARSSCRCTTTCSPATEPTGAPRGCAWERRATQAAAADDAAAGTGRAALPRKPHKGLCDRTFAVADVKRRFGEEPLRPAGSTCCAARSSLARCRVAPGRSGEGHPRGRRPYASAGRTISIELNPGTGSARTPVLDVPGGGTSTTRAASRSDAARGGAWRHG